MVHDAEFSKLGNPHIGSEFELNDNRGVVVGIAKVSTSGLFGLPTLYTTYERAIQYIPNPRYTISLCSCRAEERERHTEDQATSCGARLSRADQR